ncbi:YfhO family protein [Enterococcus sp. LJL120]
MVDINQGEVVSQQYRRSGRKRQRQRSFKIWLLIYSLLFLAIFLIGYYPVLAKQLTLIWNVDGVGQYYPAFIYIGQYLQNFFSGLLHGQFILPSYDLSIGMGEDIISALNYYGFGDPLNLIAIFVTKNNSAFLFSGMIVLRMWLAGLSLSLYFRYLKLDYFAAVLASLCYAFSGFSIFGGTSYSQWLAVVIYGPLLLLGIEKILKENKPLLFLLAVFYGGLCGFYYLFMASLMLAVYLVIRLIFMEASFKNFFLTIFKALGYYLLGLFLAAPIFLPALVGYFNSERVSVSLPDIIFNLQNYLPVFDFNLLDYLAQPFYQSHPYLSGVLLLEFLAVIVLFFLPNTRRKFQIIVVLCIGVIAYLLPITGYLFNGFGQTNDRWHFLLQLLFCGIFAYVITEIRKLAKKRFVATKRKALVSIVVQMVLVILVAVNISVNIRGLYAKSGFNWMDSLIAYQDFQIYTDSPFTDSQVSTEAVEEGVYRVANSPLTTINGRPENVAMLNGYFGLTYWFSIINQNTQELVDKQIGDDLNWSWRSFGFGTNVGYNTISGVKYYLSNEAVADANYQLVEQVSFNDEVWYIYENLSYRGLAYTVSDTVIADETENMPAKVNQIASEIISEDSSTRVTYEGNQVDIHLNTENLADKSLAIGIPYHEYWQAYVDNQKTEVDKTDTMLMSVAIASDSQEVRLVYRNPWLQIGLILCALTIIFLIIQKLYQHKQKNKYRS